MVLAQRQRGAAGQGKALAWGQRVVAGHGAPAAVALEQAASLGQAVALGPVVVAMAEAAPPQAVVAAPPGRTAALQAEAARVRLSAAAFVVRRQVSVAQMALRQALPGVRVVGRPGLSPQAPRVWARCSRS